MIHLIRFAVPFLFLEAMFLFIMGYTLDSLLTSFYFGVGYAVLGLILDKMDKKK